MNFRDGEARGFHTERLTGEVGSGYRYTLTTILGEFLRDLEIRYGPRDRAFTPLGIEFCGEIPQIWFPNNSEFVSIILSEDASLNPQKATFQLAHEAVHLLAPVRRATAPIVEEGLATLFQIEINQKYELGLKVELSSYQNAANIVSPLINTFPEIIRELREIKPNFYDWDKVFLDQNLPEKIRYLSKVLCSNFSR